MMSVNTGVIGTLALAALPTEAAGSDWSIEFSGQYRVRVEDYKEPFIGLASVDEFTSLAHRLLGGVRAGYKNRFHLFAQLGTFAENGRKPRARPIDEGELDIQ